MIPTIIAFVSFIMMDQANYSGTLTFKRNNLHSITIKRDHLGIPTIEGQDFKDVNYGLGFAHGQDRLWSVHFKKLLFSGRLSEGFGVSTLQMDQFMRSISLYRYAKSTWEHMDEEQKDILRAYTAGFNDAVKSTKLLPIEFWLSWQKYDPLTPIDVITLSKGISFLLAYGYHFEVMYNQLEDLFGPEKMKDLIPRDEKNILWNNITILNDDDLQQMGIYEKYDPAREFSAPSGLKFPDERRPPRPPTKITFDTPSDTPTAADDNTAVHPPNDLLGEPITTENNLIAGSNSWVIHGNHTTTGKPILANDPHLTNGIPSYWYNAQLRYGDNYISGVSMPGMPAIVIGKTKHVAWGFTAHTVDIGDLYVITRKDNMYQYDGHWYPLREFSEDIKVKNKNVLDTFKVYETHHGVLIDPYFLEFFGKKHYKPKESLTYALAWTGYTHDDTTLSCFFNFFNAKNAQEVVRVWEGAAMFAMNLHFATVQGDIGFMTLGRIPIRKSHQKHGMKPLDGSKSENDWAGYMPFEDQPRVINPKKGYIVSANNKIATNNLRWHASASMVITPRAVRIHEMIANIIESGKKISVDDVKAMQLDVLDVLARDLVPIIIKCTNEANNLGYKPSLATQENIQVLLDQLKNWDFRMEKDSVPAAIMAVWEWSFEKRILKAVNITEDARKTLVDEYFFDNFVWRKVIEWASLDKKLFNQDWCQNNDTKGEQYPCLVNLVRSLEDTWVYLSKKVGSNVAEWQWQKIHSNQYPHTPFSQTLAKRFFHESVPTSGNTRTVMVSAVKPATTEFAGIWSANMRMIHNMGVKDETYFVIDTGISGRVQSKHYTDQMEIYHQDKWLQMKDDAPTQWTDKLDITFQS